MKAISPFLIKYSEESREFISDSENDCDVLLEYSCTEQISFDADKVIYRQKDKFYCPDGTVYLKRMGASDPYAFVTKTFSGKHVVTCHYLKGYERELCYSRNVYTVFGLEDILLDFDTIILHASYVIHNGYAILFSGPSGIGKSTQADLWEKYRNAFIVNGDRAAIKMENGQWYAYGLPIAGSSGLYFNKKAPIKAIVLLKQSAINTVHKPGLASVYRYLYPQVLMHRWDPAFEKKADALLTGLIQTVPVYLLECRPDQEAVSCLSSAVFKEDI